MSFSNHATLAFDKPSSNFKYVAPSHTFYHLGTDGSLQNVMTAKNANIGIGTTSPQQKLHVEGGIQGIGLFGAMITDSTSTVSSSVAASATALKTVYDIASASLNSGGGTIAGNLTVGGTVTTSNLNVIGSTTIINAITTQSSNVRIENNTGTGPALTVIQNSVLGLGSGDIASFYDSNVSLTTPVFTIADGGNVGIGTGRPKYTLDIEGYAHITCNLVVGGSITASAITGFNYPVPYRTTIRPNSAQYVFTVTVTGDHTLSEDNVDVFINGLKLAYISSQQNDYTVATSSVNQVTTVTITLNQACDPYDIVDIHVYTASVLTTSSSITASSISGLANVATSGDYDDLTNKTFLNQGGTKTYFMGNVGIGKTATTSYALDVNGTVNATSFKGDGSELYNLPIVSSVWQNQNNLVYVPSTCNVGIGSTAPVYPLDVVGIVRATEFRGDGSQLTGLYSGPWKSSGTISYVEQFSNVGIGTSIPQYELDVKGTINASYLSGDGSQLKNVSGLSTIAGVEGWIGSASVIPVLNIADTGRIIGVSSCNVQINASAVSGLATVATTGDYNNLSNITFVQYQGLSATYSGKVGIGGTPHTTAQLAVYGDVFSTGTITASNLTVLGDTVLLNTTTSNTENLVINNAGTAPALKVIQSGANNVAEFYDFENGDTPCLYIANGGNVGIATKQPNYAFHVQGDLYVSGRHIAENFYTIALSDETTTLTTGVSVVTFRSPYRIKLTKVPRACLNNASSSGDVVIDINKNGTSIFNSTKLTIGATSSTSVGYASQASLLTNIFEDDAAITMDIDAAGTNATGLKVTLYYQLD